MPFASARLATTRGREDVRVHASRAGRSHRTQHTSARADYIDEYRPAEAASTPSAELCTKVQPALAVKIQKLVRVKLQTSPLVSGQSLRRMRLTTVAIRRRTQDKRWIDG